LLRVRKPKITGSGKQHTTFLERVEMQILSILLGAAFLAVAALHAYWAIGGRAGIDKAIPTVDGRPLFIPGPAATFAVAGVLVAFSATAVVLGFFAHLLGDYRLLPQVAGFAIGVVLILRAVGEFRYVGFFKRNRDSAFARYDTWLFSPFCLITGAAFLVLSVSG
jgi:hypothetical protein